MSRVYLIKPLEDKKICWSINMHRKNPISGVTSQIGIVVFYRSGQGFVNEDMAANLPFEGDLQARAQTDCGWDTQLNDQYDCQIEFTDDITKVDQYRFREAFIEGDPNDNRRIGIDWLFNGNHNWQLEDEYLVIDSPYQVSLCEADGTVVEENVKLKTRG